VTQTAGLDHFLLVAADSAAPRAAPWAKSGQAAAWSLFLGNEEDSNWSGWFDASEALATAGLQHASGAWLEGLVDVPAVFGAAPATLRVALGAWSNPDGGALQRQVPCGDGDGVVAASEWVSLSAPGTVSVPSAPPRAGRAPRLRLLGGNPTRGELRFALDPAEPGAARVELVDLAGRRLAVLHDGVGAAAFEGRADLRALGRALPAGVYFVRAVTAAGSDARRFVLLP
jgi:hypothetical protein